MLTWTGIRYHYRVYLHSLIVLASSFAEQVPIESIPTKDTKSDLVQIFKIHTRDTCTAILTIKGVLLLEAKSITWRSTSPTLIDFSQIDP